jgi:hypothetical protein
MLTFFKLHSYSVNKGIYKTQREMKNVENFSVLNIKKLILFDCAKTSKRPSCRPQWFLRDIFVCYIKPVR